MPLPPSWANQLAACECFQVTKSKREGQPVTKLTAIQGWSYSQSNDFLSLLPFLVFLSPGSCLQTAPKHLQSSTAQFKWIFAQKNLLICLLCLSLLFNSSRHYLSQTFWKYLWTISDVGAHWQTHITQIDSQRIMKGR